VFILLPVVLVFVPPVPVVARELPSLVLEGAEELIVLVVTFVDDANGPSEDNTHGAVWARNRPHGDNDDDPSSRADDNARTSKEPVPFNSTIVPDSLLVPTILPTNAVGMDGNVTIGLSLGVAVVDEVVVTVGGASCINDVVFDVFIISSILW
jgi:hypothetical protein